jgi:SNF2 family DNA or RNA helicase
MIVECGDEFHKSGTVLEQIIRLRQICLDPRILPEVGIDKPGVKTEALLNIIESSDNQIVIFSSYKTYANLIAAELKKRKISYELLTGDTKQSVRVGQLKRFQEGKSKIFLGTIKAGGVGLNLQCASTLIFTDKDYSPAINEQSEARIHRIGQKNAAEIITLYTKDTVDELMEEMLEARGAMINGIITPTKMWQEMMK